MASPSKKAFLLRLDPQVHDALQRWADDELRSLNNHLDYLLREALRKAGRKPALVGRKPRSSEADAGAPKAPTLGGLADPTTKD